MLPLVPWTSAEIGLYRDSEQSAAYDDWPQTIISVVPYGKPGKKKWPLICATGKGIGVDFVSMSMALVNYLSLLT